MAEQTIQTAPTQADPKTTANNIVQGIKDRSYGKTPEPKVSKGQSAPAEPPAPVDPNAGKEKYVVDGKDVWLSPDQARAYVQKGISFEPKVDQLNRLQRETQEFLKTLSSDPLKILTDKRIGMTPEAVMEKVFASGQINDQLKERVGRWYYENVVAPMKMSPEEREAAENKKKLMEFEAREASARDQMMQLQNQQRIEMAMNQIKAQISEAMKDSGLPNNDTPLGAEMARMVADTMRVAQLNRQQITPKQAIEYVKQRIKAVQSAYYDVLDEESLVKELGEKNAEKVKKYFLKLVKEAEKNPTVGKERTRKDEKKHINMDDFHDYLDDLKKKG